MTKLANIVESLNNYLKIYDIKDTCWNGLQLEGTSEVKKIAFAVDASIETFKIAIEKQADLIVVHHGHFWHTQNPSITSWARERIDILYKHQMSLYACHLPLDRHRIVGNNARLLKLLRVAIKSEFLLHEGKNIGWIGMTKRAVSLKQIGRKLNTELNTNCIVLPFGKEKVKTIAVCSGGGGYGGFYEALNSGVDLYITGDAIEVYYTAQDSKMNVIFAGHHATETLGLKALAEVVKRKFRIHCMFIDLPTGL
jgi:dinuclear metal center YbgI/SA1388 family protein